MKRNSGAWVLIFLSFLSLFVFSAQVEAACRNPNLVKGFERPVLLPVASSGFVEIKWFGHSFFQITSSAGTRIITDPFHYMGYPMPEVSPHVVTVGKETRNHSNVALAKGDPLILRGLKSWGGDWDVVNTTFRDVLIYNVPIHTKTWVDFMKGSAFVIELDGLCICHTGDVGEPFNEDQLDLLGHIDILLVPIGGRYAIGPENAKKVVEQLKPKIAVPMHYFNNSHVLESFVDGTYRSRFLDGNQFTVSKETLPRVTEIFVPKVQWHGGNDDGL